MFTNASPSFHDNPDCMHDLGSICTLISGHVVAALGEEV